VRGFSLFELVVVLLILALAAAVAVPAVQSGWRAREIRQGTRELAGVMRGLRERALRTGVEQELVIEPDGQTYRWSEGGTARLPSAAWITGVHGGWRDEEGRLGVIFYPNGGATAAGMVVGGADEQGLRFAIDVNALLGSVVIRDVTS
jgi:general secretion pathway protein H